MTPVQAAARLNVHETAVTGVREHPLGHVVSLRKGPDMLVAASVARVYLPEVDDYVPLDGSGFEIASLEPDGSAVIVAREPEVATEPPRKAAKRAQK